MDYIKTISGCDNLKDRELNLNGVLIKQKCSIKCVNALKKGNIFKSIKTIPSVDHLNIRDKPNLCGYPYKSKSSNNNKSKSKSSNNKSKSSNNKSKSSKWWPF